MVENYLNSERKSTIREREGKETHGIGHSIFAETSATQPKPVITKEKEVIKAIEDSALSEEDESSEEEAPLKLTKLQRAKRYLDQKFDQVYFSQFLMVVKESFIQLTVAGALFVMMPIELRQSLMADQPL